MLQSTRQPTMAPTPMSAIDENDGPDLNTREAAEFLSVSFGSMKIWRARDKGPPYYRGLKREVLYRRSDLIAFRESLRVTPGHDHKEAA